MASGSTSDLPRMIDLSQRSSNSNNPHRALSTPKLVQNNKDPNATQSRQTENPRHGAQLKINTDIFTVASNKSLPASRGFSSSNALNTKSIRPTPSTEKGTFRAPDIAKTGRDYKGDGAGSPQRHSSGFNSGTSTAHNIPLRLNSPAQAHGKPISRTLVPIADLNNAREQKSSKTSATESTGAHRGSNAEKPEKLKKRAPHSVLSSRLGSGTKRVDRRESQELTPTSAHSAGSKGFGNPQALRSPRHDNNDVNQRKTTIPESPDMPVRRISSTISPEEPPSKRQRTSEVKETVPTATDVSRVNGLHGNAEGTSLTSRRAGHGIGEALVPPSKIASANGSTPEQRKARSQNTSVPRISRTDLVTKTFQNATEVQAIFQKHLDRLVFDHQYWTKAWLPRNRLSAEAQKQRDNERTESSTTAWSPFTSMKVLDRKSTGKTSSVSASVSVENICFPVSARPQSTTYKKVWPETGYLLKGEPIPRYTSNAALKTNLLAENVKMLAVWPYFLEEGDDENATETLYPELKQRYNHGNPDERLALLTQREKSKQYKDYIKEALDEIGITPDDLCRHYLEHDAINLPETDREKILQDEDSDEDDSDKRQLKRKWSEVLSRLHATTDARTRNTEFATEAFEALEGGSLWHIARALSEREKKRPDGTSVKSQPLLKYKTLACRVCHLHDCDYHGEFKEKKELAELNEDDGSDLVSSDEDDPATINQKIRVNSYLEKHTPVQQPLAYQAEVRPDGRTTGRIVDAAGAAHDAPSDLKDVICSADCFFLKIYNKTRTATPWNEKDIAVEPWSQKDFELFKALVSVFGSNKHGPCFMAKVMLKPCIQVFLRLLNRSLANTKVVPQPEKPPERPKKLAQKKSVHKSIVHREPFVPCNHQGSCEQAECRCFLQGVFCEAMCRCSSSCERRFRGCSCARVGKICWQNRRCICFQHDRECDVDLCGSCGADEVLDPRNRSQPDICVGRCKNVGIQRNVAKRTFLGSSEVNGFGLFAGEVIKRHEFIAEYKGELLSEEESNRRGAIYDWRSASYLFKLNKTQDVDATHEGNKTRFINSSSDYINTNCEPALMLCHTVTRIGIYALRDIQPGQELFFNYRYPPSKMEHFKEKIQKDGETVLVNAKATKQETKRVRRKADAQSSLLSGLKQQATTDTDGPSGEYRQSLHDYGIMQSDTEDEAEEIAQREAEEQALLKAILEKEGNDDDDYEERESSFHSDEEKHDRSRTRVLRSTRSGAASADTTPVKREKRPRSP